MKKVTVYMGPMCAYCDAAKRLLVRNNIPYEEVNIALDTEQRDIMLKNQMVKGQFHKFSLTNIT